MEKKAGKRLFAAALCLLLAGCGTQAAAPRPEEETKPAAEPSGAAEPEPAEAEDGYTGRWRDQAEGASQGQCAMAVTKDSGDVYGIAIRWEREDGSADCWQFTGTYDEIWEGIDYIGARYREETSGGEVQTSAVLAEETGLLYLDTDGALLWEDTFEHMGDGMRFEREA